MDSCDRQIRAYKNGKTLDECKDTAESLNPEFKNQIDQNGKFSGVKYLRLLITMN